MPRWTARAEGLIRRAATRALPERMQRRLLPAYRRLSAWPPVGSVRFGSLRRLTPISRSYGQDRGQPIDRYYIEEFLKRQVSATGSTVSLLRGRVLEIEDSLYTRQFADLKAIDQIDVLDPSADNPRATIVGDLTDPSTLPMDAFDCIICIQTLLLIYELSAAVETLHRALKPGGALLVTVPGISAICRPEAEIWGDYWRFTDLSLRRLMEEWFRPEHVTVEAYGNVLTSAAFLYGLTVRDLKSTELDERDADYQLLIGAKAVKAP